MKKTIWSWSSVNSLLTGHLNEGHIDVLSPSYTWNELFLLSVEQLSSSKLNLRLVWRPIMFRTSPVLGVICLVSQDWSVSHGYIWADIDFWCLPCSIKKVILHTDHSMQWLCGSCHDLISLTLHDKFYFRKTVKSHFVKTEKIPLNVQHDIHFIDLMSSNSNMILLSSFGQVLLIKEFGTDYA